MRLENCGFTVKVVIGLIIFNYRWLVGGSLDTALRCFQGSWSLRKRKFVICMLISLDFKLQRFQSVFDLHLLISISVFPAIHLHIRGDILRENLH